MSKQLEWVPLKIQRVLGSSIWNLRDFQFGWFWRAIINLCVQPDPGYVTVVGAGSVELWKFFGAKSEQYFRTWGGNEFSERYFPKTEDGTRRYNPQLLAILADQSKKIEMRNNSKKDAEIFSSLSLSVVDFDSLDSKTEKLFEEYKQIFERTNGYSLTERRRKKCAARLCELMKANGGDLERACELARKAMSNLRHSKFHWGKGYYDWIDHLFDSQERFEKTLQMKANDEEDELARARKVAGDDDF